MRTPSSVHCLILRTKTGCPVCGFLMFDFPVTLGFAGELFQVAVGLFLHHFPTSSGSAAVSRYHEWVLTFRLNTELCNIANKYRDHRFYWFLMMRVVGVTFMMLDPGASTSYKFSRFFFDLLFSWILRSSFS